MKEKILKLKQEVLGRLESCQSLPELKEIENIFFGRKGKISSIMRSIKNLSLEEKKVFGKLANETKKELDEFLQNTKTRLLQTNKRGREEIDSTLPGQRPKLGSLHPHTQMLFDLNEAFLSLGFEVYEGPEISSEAYAFDNLNFPPSHPARESMDTYWLAGSENKKGKDRLCLRPHLTGGSVRYMQTHQPPYRFVYPGRVFRSEATDASHERCFYQYEALIVDREVPFSAGRVMVNTILQRVFGREIKTRMRSGFFPFVEPGFEIDMQCLVCGGKGCSVCKRTGWVEMMPGGPPHPNVLRAAGVNPKEWQGFYINIGLDRLVMMKYGIDDIRLFHSGDLRFLRQF